MTAIVHPSNSTALVCRRAVGGIAASVWTSAAAVASLRRNRRPGIRESWRLLSDDLPSFGDDD